MAAFENLIGRRFERLLVTAECGRSGSNKILWACLCDCGNVSRVTTQKLKSGSTKSCGCLRLEVIARQGRKNSTHGKTGSREFNSWTQMRQRCENRKHKDYPNYGGRGITVCDQWQKFEQFYADMGPRPVRTTLERNEVNGNYEPNNCRWATALEQARNRRNTRKIGGVPVTELAETTGKSIYKLIYEFEREEPTNES